MGTLLSEAVQKRAVSRVDFQQWKQLWEGYNAFYGRSGETALSSSVYPHDPDAFFDSYEPMHTLIAERAGGIVELAHFLYHRSAIQIPPTCYLAGLCRLSTLRVNSSPIRVR
jgi:hypothetical protein